MNFLKSRLNWAASSTWTGLEVLSLSRSSASPGDVRRIMGSFFSLEAYLASSTSDLVELNLPRVDPIVSVLPQGFKACALGENSYPLAALSHPFPPPVFVFSDDVSSRRFITICGVTGLLSDAVSDVCSKFVEVHEFSLISSLVSGSVSVHEDFSNFESGVWGFEKKVNVVSSLSSVVVVGSLSYADDFTLVTSCLQFNRFLLAPVPSDSSDSVAVALTSDDRSLADLRFLGVSGDVSELKSSILPLANGVATSKASLYTLISAAAAFNPPVSS